MARRLFLILVCMTCSLAQDLLAAPLERIWVLNDSDPVYCAWRRDVTRSRRYRGRYVRSFTFAPLRWAEYVMKHGDTLQTVAVRLGISVDAIASASGIVHVHAASPGDRLIIPNFDGISYTSSAGVRLADLSQKYDVPQEDIRRFNGSSAQWVPAGARVFIPGGTMSPLEQGLFYGTAFSPPLDAILVTSGYGVRSDPFSGRQAFHGGVDLAAPAGTAVKAAHEGIVEFSGWSGGYGNLIVVRHAFGYRTLYGHLSRRDVRPGMRLAMGAHLGAVGSTGASTGPHLHFEIQHHGATVDPARYTSLQHRDRPAAAPVF